MSMDDTKAALIAFERELDRFTSQMNEAVNSLEREHARASGLWRDSFSKEYHSRWRTFDDHVKRYLRHDAPKYRGFLKAKIRQASQYLGS